jgi:hypothetical protein
MIPVHEVSELAQYGFDPGGFRKTGRDSIGGQEFTGLCPGCGADHMIVSNGKYWCRKECGTQGFIENLAKANGIEIDEKAIEASRREAEAKKERDRIDQQNKLKALNESRVWEEFHENLLRAPDRLAELDREGIHRKLVEQYAIGFNPRFRPFDHEMSRWVEVQAFTFPILGDDYCFTIRNKVLDEAFVKRTKAKYLPYRSNLPIKFLGAYEPGDNVIVIVEGEKKAIVLKDHGIPAIGIWGVNMFKSEWMPWTIKRFERRYVLFDSDNWHVMMAAERLAKDIQGAPIYLKGKPDDLLVSGQITAEDIRHEMKEANHEFYMPEVPGRSVPEPAELSGVRQVRPRVPVHQVQPVH